MDTDGAMTSFLANHDEFLHDVHDCTDGDAIVNERTNPSAECWLRDMDLIARNRDKEAFSKLFTYFAPRVKSYLLKSGLDNAQAEDCLQETFARVWLKAEQFNPTRGAVSTWIFTIARNTSIDAFRKLRDVDATYYDDTSPECGPEDTLVQTQDVENLEFALQNLPSEQRDIIEAAYFREMSHTEIAKNTGIPLGTIKSRLRLALRRLTGDLR